MANQANMAALRAVARLLGPLLNQMVFVGGSAVGPYNTRNQAESRPTVDVDCITVSPRSAYYALEEKLLAWDFELAATLYKSLFRMGRPRLRKPPMRLHTSSGVSTVLSSGL